MKQSRHTPSPPCQSWASRASVSCALRVCELLRQATALCTDHSGPGAGGAGQEAALVLQGGAAHLGHVLRELRAEPPLLGGGATGLTPPPPRELEPPAGPGNSEHPQPNSFHRGSAEPPADQIKDSGVDHVPRKEHQRRRSNTACIYLFSFLPKGRFLLAGNSILCVHECAFATC